METVAKERQLQKNSEKSRNGVIIKSSTQIALNKTVKSATPLKSTNAQRSTRKEASLTPREKALVKQSMEIKKENSELIKLLKKSKELFKDEINKSKAENQNLKSLLEAVWPIVDSRIDEKLREQIKNAIGVKEITKMCTNDTEHISAKHPIKLLDSPKNDQEIASLKEEIAAKEAQNLGLLKKLNVFDNEIECMHKYWSLISMKKVKNEQINMNMLPVDSANIGSECEEDEVFNSKLGKSPSQCHKSEWKEVIPGFVQSLILKIQ